MITEWAARQSWLHGPAVDGPLGGRLRRIHGSRQFGALRRVSARPLGALSILVVATCVVIVVVVPSSFAAGLLLGGFLMSVTAVAAFWVLLVSGSAWAVMGATADRWTARGLRPLTKHGWRLLSRLELHKRDLDHVLIGEGGAYVVDTEWRGDAWPDEIDDRLRSAAHHAASDARTLARWHGFEELAIKVRPVVVLWDPEQREQHEACQYWIDGVILVRGCCLPDWTASLPSGELGRAKVAAAWAVLQR